MSPELQYIKNIGPKRQSALKNSGIITLFDLLEYYPRRYVDRTKMLPLNNISIDTEVTVYGKIEAAGIRRGRKPIFYIVISDGKGILEAIWFNQASIYKSIFKVGEWVSLSGKISFYRGHQMVHPDYDKIGGSDFDSFINTGKIIPIYPGSENFKKVGLNSYTFRRIFHRIFSEIKREIPEILPDKICRKNQFLDRYTCFENIHLPKSEEFLSKAIKRLKYEELFFLQLMLVLQKKHFKKNVPGLTFAKKSIHLEKLFHQLPFKMTEAQKRVVKEIREDMKKTHPMNRLLQGDVGSGKTLVALMAMLIAVDNNYQSALMVPTEILAEQHYLNISKLLAETKIPVLLLTGNTTTKEREEIKNRISSGEALIIIGTHALIQEDITFLRLGLVVIDEQHRFGVIQKGILLEKGIQADVLVMTATPIPRTLALTLHGNLDVSVIDELPANRPVIDTLWRNEDKTDEINQFIKKRVKNNDQVFFVYPLVEESEKLDLKAATESYQYYRDNIFPEFNVALIHGQLRSDEKDRIMRDFSEGKIDILFSTSVIEVGIDIPNATIMVIEHAERFGLSQLHQLRGRIGRGNKKSYCILKSPYSISDTAERRLQIMTETDDGFKIADEDLKIRGWGEFFGTRQHGIPTFKIANPVQDHELLQTARQDAITLVENDPHLRNKENQSLREYFVDSYKDKLNYINIS